MQVKKMESIKKHHTVPGSISAADGDVGMTQQKSFSLDPLLNMREVLGFMKWSRSTLYNRIRAKEFPPPLCTGQRTRVWRSSDVMQFIERCAGR